jgi:hypothetical protein
MTGIGHLIPLTEMWQLPLVPKSEAVCPNHASQEAVLPHSCLNPASIRGSLPKTCPNRATQEAVLPHTWRRQYCPIHASREAVLPPFMPKSCLNQRKSAQNMFQSCHEEAVLPHRRSTAPIMPKSCLLILPQILPLFGRG